MRNVNLAIECPWLLAPDDGAEGGESATDGAQPSLLDQEVADAAARESQRDAAAREASLQAKIAELDKRLAPSAGDTETGADTSYADDPHMKQLVEMRADLTKQVAAVKEEIDTMRTTAQREREMQNRVRYAEEITDFAEDVIKKTPVLAENEAAANAFRAEISRFNERHLRGDMGLQEQKDALTLNINTWLKQYGPAFAAGAKKADAGDGKKIDKRAEAIERDEQRRNNAAGGGSLPPASDETLDYSRPDVLEKLYQQEYARQTA